MARWKLKLPPLFTRRLFREHAKRIKMTFNGVDLGDLVPVENATKSLGWRHDTKCQIRVGGCDVWCQVNLSFTVINSAELPT